MDSKRRESVDVGSNPVGHWSRTDLKLQIRRKERIISPMVGYELDGESAVFVSLKHHPELHRSIDLQTYFRCSREMDGRVTMKSYKGKALLRAVLH